MRGLELHANAGGKSWKLYYRNPSCGTRRRPKLPGGDFPNMPIEVARKLAKEWLQEIARGNDPSAERTAYRGTPTVSEACDAWLTFCATRDKPRTYTEKARRVRLYIKPQLGKLKVCDVRLADVDRCLEHARQVRSVPAKTKNGKPTKLRMGGATTARHVRSDLSGLFRWCEHDDNRWRERNSNPVRDAKRFSKPKRRRHMREDEAPAVARALDAMAVQWPERVAALWIILLAGTRVTELVTAKRAWLEGNTIVRPDHKTDQDGDPRVIVLPDQAVAILAKLNDDGSGFLFGRDLGEDEPRARYKIRTVWALAREKAGCPDLRVQDFRRTFASAAKSAGRDLDQVGELFGHRERETVQSYAFLFDEAATRVAQDTADQLEKRMRGEKEQQE
ncbi:hypothetical protein APY04_0152 [Hyphomicrobium sulfonivorans]|uniref:Integrase n=1 Tax=Hyphomicrobium sulfonivorans TaxID=121290 RepID=A0A125NWA4_HYPSL|nr:hypothetical protein APY04_0152 [Hyphomicrobium sulfonivorans]